MLNTTCFEDWSEGSWSRESSKTENRFSWTTIFIEESRRVDLDLFHCCICWLWYLETSVFQICSFLKQYRFYWRVNRAMCSLLLCYIGHRYYLVPPNVLLYRVTTLYRYFCLSTQLEFAQHWLPWCQSIGDLLWGHIPKVRFPTWSTYRFSELNRILKGAMLLGLSQLLMWFWLFQKFRGSWLWIVLLKR